MDFSMENISEDEDISVDFSDDEDVTRSKSPRRDWKFGSDHNPDSSEDSDNDQFFSVRKSPRTNSASFSPLTSEVCPEAKRSLNPLSSNLIAETTVLPPAETVAANKEANGKCESLFTRPLC